MRQTVHNPRVNTSDTRKEDRTTPMKRISHDLPGVTQRIAKLTDEYHVAIEETTEVWRDAKGLGFMQRHTSEIRPSVNQLVSSLTKSIELFEEIAKKIRDPDEYR